MPIKLNTDSGGGVTLQGANTVTDFTMTVPAASGVILYDGSDLSSQVKSALNASGSAPIYASRAWVNFNGTGTVAIRASGNVTSITDNGTGTYAVNLTTAMPDANYAAVISVEGTSLSPTGEPASQTTTVLNIECQGRATSTAASTDQDMRVVSVSIFR